MNKRTIFTLLSVVLMSSMATACVELSKKDRALLTSVQTTAQEAKDESSRASAAAELARSEAQAAQESAAKAAADAKASQEKANRIFRQSQSK